MGNLKSGLCSIIMPAYNTELYIADSIESVLAQTYKNWQLIIVDDCSTDSTKSIIKRYQALDSRIKLICLEKNGGVANARNLAIKHACGQYVAFLDSDDLWLPEKLSKQIKFMQDNHCLFSYHNFRMLDVNTNKLLREVHVPACVDYTELLKGNRTGSCLTTCIDRSVIRDIYMPNEKHEDYICWLEILKQYGITAYGIDECLGYYKVGKMSVSSNKLKSALWTWRVYRESQKLGFIEAMYYMFFYIKQGLMKHKYFYRK